MELFNIGALELVSLVALALIVFGPQRALELAGQAGRLLATLRRTINALQGELRETIEAEAQPLREAQRTLRDPLAPEPPAVEERLSREAEPRSEERKA